MSDAAPRPPLVIDLTTAWSGPLCGAVLADFGWDVVKIETSTRPDVTRRLGPFAEGVQGLERSGYFDSLNRRKRSVALDLRNPEGRRIARELCLAADVVVENFSPGVMDRLGLGYDELAAENSRLIMVSISGYGATGPEHKCVAYGQTVEAYTGMDAATGYPGGEPAACGAPIADHIGGMTGAFAAFAALRHQRATGEGQHIDVSMVEALIAMMPSAFLDYQIDGTLPEPHGNLDREMAPHGCYPCVGDDRWIAIAVNTDDEWRAFCDVLGLDDLAADGALDDAHARLVARDAVDERIAEVTAMRDGDELVGALRNAGVPATMVLNSEGLMADETLRARGFLTPIETNEVGPRVIAGRQASISFADAPITRGGPRLGEHTGQILRDLLQIGDAEIDALAESGALR